MYSMVVLMALSGSATAPAWHGGHGDCYGVHGGCVGGFYNGCYGRYDCWGGATMGVSCYGWYASYLSDCFDVYVGACYGCFGVSPYTPRSRPRAEPIGPPRRPTDARTGKAPALIVVSLPADARLTIEDMPTESISDLRTFRSPLLEPDRSYTYTLKAESFRNGLPVNASKQITVRAGRETRVTLDFAASGVMAVE